MKRIPKQLEYTHASINLKVGVNVSLRSYTREGWEVLNFTESVSVAYGHRITAWLRRELP